MIRFVSGHFIFLLYSLCLFPGVGWGAESGSRAYANAPTGLNVLQVVYSYSEESGKRDLKSDAGALYYYRYLSFFGKTALVGGFVPYADVNVSVPSVGINVSNSGIGDPTLVLGMLFSGAPALSRQEFRQYRQNTIIGGSLQISMPFGEYDASNALNIGSNRWRFRPEIAISQAVGYFVIDLFGNYHFHMENKNFRAGLVKEQKGIWGVDTHVSYTLMRGMWVSADYFRTWGGETIINGAHQNNGVRDSTIGVTIKKTLSSGFNIQGKYRHDIESQSGNKTRTYKLKLQYLW